MVPVESLGYLQQALALIGLIALGFHVLRHFLSQRSRDSVGSALPETQSSNAVAGAEGAEDLAERHTNIFGDQENRNKFPARVYSIGIITALHNELTAALAVLDERHGEPPDFNRPHDDNCQYYCGRIGDHNVVLVCFPAGQPGLVTAAHVARSLVTAFPSIRMGLMVGIGGGIPRPEAKNGDIHLGDVVVSVSGSGTTGGVVQYDSGKEEGGFVRCGSLNNPAPRLLNAVSTFRGMRRHGDIPRTIRDAAALIQYGTEDEHDEPAFAHPGSENDRLSKPWYNGPSRLPWFLYLLPANLLLRFALVQRKKRPSSAPVIHYGLIASGNKVIKRARTRDHIAAELRQSTSSDCLCFEMEAAGLMNNFPCLVIRGISDYADSHKNDSWQDYAALTAAAFTRCLLLGLQTSAVESSERARDVMNEVHDELRKINSEVSKISKGVNDEKVQEWLNPPDQSQSLENIRSMAGHHKVFSSWFFEHEAYVAWSSGLSQHLWIHGTSGCGKTVLASTIVQSLLENGLCLYFFFEFGNERKQSLEDALRSLISQLYAADEGSRAPMHRLYEFCRCKGSTPPIQKLRDTFEEMIQHMDQITIVLDALDESRKDRHGRYIDDLFEWLQQQTQHKNRRPCKLRFILTSRSDTINKSHFLNSVIREFSIEDECAGIRDDIRRYIHMRLDTGPSLSRWRKPEMESGSSGNNDLNPLFPTNRLIWDPILTEVEKVLVGKSGIMFRWTSLQMDGLGSCASVDQIKAALEDLPVGLDETYTRSLQGLRFHKDQAVRILQTLLFARRPLTEEDIYEVTSVDLKARPGYSIDKNMRMRDLEPLSCLMSSLIKRTFTRFPTTGLSRTKGKACVLQIAHASVRDYLLSSNCEPSFQSSFTKVTASAAIAEVCLAYAGSSMVNGYHNPFALCSHNSWYKLCRTEGVEEAVYDSILKFLLFNGFRLFNYLDQYLGDRILYSSKYSGSPLYVASMMGLAKTVRRLLEEGVKVSNGARKNTPLVFSLLLLRPAIYV